MKGVLILSLLALSFAAAPPTAAMEDLLGFLQGVQTGMTVNSAADDCNKDITALATDVQDVYWAVQRVIAGDEMALMALLNDVKGTMADFNTTKTDCNFSDLTFKLKELTSSGWESIIMGRIMENVGELMSNLKTLTGGCDAKSCGAAVGDTLKIIVDWGF